MITGRFAPSPTGDLHLGNLRTAMLAWCWARHGDDAGPGSFLVRVEDLTTGAAPRRTAEQIEDLAAIGVTSDVPVPPQSRRTARYDEIIGQLTAAGLTYPCFCSRSDIRDAPSAPHGPSIEGAYPGTCAALGTAASQRRVAAGERAALRLRADGAEVRVVDELLGEQVVRVDDTVLRRADGMVAYNLAVVVDDADQGVNQVVRGDDLWHTTPRHVLLQRLLDLPTPTYVHVPLVHGADGKRLSKRHGSITLRQCVADGESVAEVVGRLATSAGLAEPGEATDLPRALERFDPTTVQIAPTLPPPVRR